MYLGDIRLGDTLDFTFTTRRFSTGAPFTLAGTPSIAAYVGNGTVEITAGITLTVDFDAKTGLNHVRIVASGANGFATATNVSVVIAAGTVDSVSVANETVAAFSIENRSAVMPTVAARTLDVSATGEAGLDWANIGSPTTAQNLSATNIDVDQIVASVSGAVGSVTGAVGSVTGAVGSVAAGGITAASLAADAITAAKIADGAIDRATFAADTGLQSMRSNTAQAGAAGTITLDASASAVNDFYNDAVIYLTGGTGVGQARLISAYVGATKVATITPNWATTPDATTTFAVLPLARVDLALWLGTAPLALSAQQVQAIVPITQKVDVETVKTQAVTAAGAVVVGGFVGQATAAIGVNASGHVSRVVLVDTLTTYTGNTPQTGDAFARLGAPAGVSVSADVAAVQADTDNLQTRVPAALVAGRIDASVGAMAAAVVTAAAIATDAIDADAIAADAANEIADALLDRANGVEVGLTPRQEMRLTAAASAGKLSGAATTTVAIRNAVADTKARITATVDADGNRTAITTDVT